MKFFDAIDLVGTKQRADDPFVSGLSALAARTAGVVALGRLDDIGGGGLEEFDEFLERRAT